MGMFANNGHKALLKDINFFCTYQCNSRCVNCKIWKNKSSADDSVILTEAQLEQLFSEPLFQNCPNIGLAGGEPTISPFFWRLLELLPKDKHITITTNALSCQKLKSFLDRIDNPDNFLVQVSLDGIGKNNDLIRGVPGAYDKTIGLLEYLKKHSIKSLVSFTINRLNHHELLDCYKLAEKYDAQFSTRLAYCGGAYGNNEEKNKFKLLPAELSSVSQSLERIIDSEMLKPNHSPAHLVFLSQITQHVNSEPTNLTCLAMVSGLVIDLYGNVFPNCPAIMIPIGSLHQQRLGDIWAGERASKMREKIADFKCGGCWNDCQVVTNIQNDSDFLQDEYCTLKTNWIKVQSLHVKEIDFTNGNKELLLEGWYPTEGDNGFKYCWTEPSFSFLIPRGINRCELNAMVPKSLTQNNLVKIEMELNGIISDHVLEVENDWKNHTISLRDITQDILKCKISLSDGYCPKQSGEGEDIRTLGMAISRIRFL